MTSLSPFDWSIHQWLVIAAGIVCVAVLIFAAKRFDRETPPERHENWREGDL